MSTAVDLWCVHGFLGVPEDWDFLSQALARRDHGRPVRVTPVDVYEVAVPTAESSLDAWGRALARLASAGRSPTTRRVLLGYSLGGRLAMHALAAQSGLWDATVLVSAHPGLPSDEREDRLRRDDAWARDFETRPWDDLMTWWESLPAFGGRPAPWSRRESEHRREHLAWTLRSWSLGRQEDLFGALVRFEEPILWIAGEHDPRYVDIGRRLLAARTFAVLPSEVWIAAGAAHRVPWEVPDAFAERLGRFLDALA